MNEYSVVAFWRHDAQMSTFASSPLGRVTLESAKVQNADARLLAGARIKRELPFTGSLHIVEFLCFVLQFGNGPATPDLSELPAGGSGLRTRRR